MNKILLFLLLILIGCASTAGPKSTNWNQTPHTTVPGIVEIGTGWGKSPLCSGTLITSHHVITAGHCIKYPKEDLFLIYRCEDIRDPDCIRVPAEEVSIYPGYKTDFDSGHDLAIIKGSLAIAMLPAPISEEPLERGMPLWVAGFGRRNNSSGILYEGLARLSQDYTYEFVAAMEGRLDPNPGDSGGPAFVWENGRYRLFGVLSRSKWSGSRPLEKGQMFYHTGYAVYTKPQAYLDWIYQVTSL